MKPIRCDSSCAISAPPAPMPIAMPQMVTTRRSTGMYSGGACTVASASSINGATGRPLDALNGVGAPSGTLRSALRFVLAEHRRRGEVDLGGYEPALEQFGQRDLVVAIHFAQRRHELVLDRWRRTGEQIPAGLRHRDLDSALVRGRRGSRHVSSLDEP